MPRAGLHPRDPRRRASDEEQGEPARRERRRRIGLHGFDPGARRRGDRRACGRSASSTSTCRSRRPKSGTPYRPPNRRVEVIIVGGSIGGLTLGLMLHRAGIASRIFEATPDIRPLGVGINILPHASRASVRAGPRSGAHARAASSRARRSSTTATASSSTRSRSGATRATRTRSSRSIAATCRWRCSTPIVAARRRRPHARGLEVHARRSGRAGATAYFCDTRERRRARAAARRRRHRLRRPALGDPQAAASAAKAQPLYSGVNMWRGVTPWRAVPVRREHGARRLARLAARW